ncbi:aldehyde oxidase 1 [Platysternon megacephalum]|uniref:Aldehyde oxidase 1 n=1 Tax=Platysternon megacephalum TaxID=55544 RepID=A0A4D9EZL2_9SAUR|nr:aldehyde oxidase 1 [Platysternon megacephalum]
MWNQRQPQDQSYLLLSCIIRESKKNIYTSCSVYFMCLVPSRNHSAGWYPTAHLRATLPSLTKTYSQTPSAFCYLAETPCLHEPLNPTQQLPNPDSEPCELTPVLGVQVCEGSGPLSAGMPA